MSIYVPLYVIRDELYNYYKKNGTCTDLPSICANLLTRPDLFLYEYVNPFPEDIDSLDDDQFIRLFYNSLYPLDKAEQARMDQDAYSYLAETLFSKDSLFRIFLHENYVDQKMHSHDFFEVTYVYRGHCRLCFPDSDDIVLEEGNVCLFAPHIMHKAVIRDKESFVVNMSMTKEAFEAAISVVLLRNDLIASYIRTILFEKESTGYLMIPSYTTENIKNAVKHIAYSKRSEEPFSYAMCISWFSVFMCEVFKNFRANIKTFQSNKTSLQSDYFLLLDYIQNNYSTITLSSVADIFNYNKAYLSRLIKNITGHSFVDIITEMKLSAACELLKSTDLSLDQIAEIVGYNSGDYLSKAFRKKYRQSANYYRTAHKLTVV